jgi:SNF-related kinase
VLQTPNNTYLITEFCDGGDLESRVTKEGRLQESFVQEIMQGVVSGYAQIRSRGIVHRDLKPANILLSK